MNTIWVMRPGALGDTVLMLPFLNALSKQNKNTQIVFWGTSVYSPALQHFLPQIEYRDFQSRDLLPLFHWEFQPQELTLEKPDQVFCFFNTDPFIQRNLELIS